MDFESEFLHTIQQQANRQITGIKSAYVGYIQSYDPIRHMVQVLNPLAGDATIGGGDMGYPLKSPWIPLASSHVGLSNGQGRVNPNVDSYGIQIAPLGGASTYEPTAGEQVLVINLQNEIGYSACAFLMFNDHAIPPGAGIPVLGVALQPGEMLVVTCTGAVVHFGLDGSVNIFARNAGTQNGDLNATANGSMTFATVLDGTPPTAVLSGNIDMRSRNEINTFSVGNTTVTADSQTGGILITTIVGSSLPATGDIFVNSADNVNVTAQEKIVEQAGLDIELSAAHKIKATGLLGVSIAAGLPQFAPADNNFEVESLVDCLITSGSKSLFQSHFQTSINSTNHGIVIAAHTAATPPLDGDVDIRSHLDTNILPERDLLMNPAFNATMRAQAGGIIIATANETPVTLANDICIYGTQRIRLRSHNNGIAISTNSIEPTISNTGDIQMQSQQNTNIYSVAGGISLGAATDPRGFLSNGVVYIAANTSLTATSRSLMTFNALNAGIGISTGSPTVNAAGQNIEIVSRGILNLFTGTGGTDIMLGSQRDIGIGFTRNMIAQTTASGFIGLTTTGGTTIGSGDIQINAADTTNISGVTAVTLNTNGTITIYTNHSSTGDIKIGNQSSGTFYQLLTKHLWDNYLVNHVHSGVIAGGANTGPPVGVPTMQYPECTNILEAN